MNSPQTPLNPQLLAQLQAMQGGGAGAPSSTPGLPPQPTSVQPDADASGMGGGPPQTQAPAGGQPPTQGPDLAQLTQSALQRQQSLNPQADAAIQARATQQIPQVGPQIQHGASFLHNLGQVLQMAAEATAPGRNIVGSIYENRAQQYGARQAQLANQVGDIKGQQELAQQGAQSGLMAQYHQDVTGERQTHDRATEATGQQNADTRKQGLTIRATDIANRYNLGKANLDEKNRANVTREAQQAVDEAGRNYRAEHRDATTEDVAHVMSQAHMDITNELAAKDPSVVGWLWGQMGLETPQVPGGQAPVQRPQQVNPPAKAKPTARTAQGGGHKVGQTVTIKGKPMTITAVHPDGSFDAK